MNNESVMLERANQYIGAINSINRSDVKEFASLIKEMAEKNKHELVTESSLQIKPDNTKKNKPVKFQDPDNYYGGTNDVGDELFYVPMHVKMKLKDEVQIYDIAIQCMIEAGEKHMVGYTIIGRRTDNQLAQLKLDHLYDIQSDRSKEMLVKYTKIIADTCDIIMNSDIDRYIGIFNYTLISTIANLKEKGIAEDDGTPYTMGCDCIDTGITFYRNDKKFKCVVIPDNDLHMIQVLGVPYDEKTDNIKSLNLKEICVTKDNVNDDDMQFKLHFRLHSILAIANYQPWEDKSLYDMTKEIAIKLHGKLQGKYK